VTSNYKYRITPKAELRRCRKKTAGKKIGQKGALLKTAGRKRGKKGALLKTAGKKGIGILLICLFIN